MGGDTAREWQDSAGRTPHPFSPISVYGNLVQQQTRAAAQAYVERLGQINDAGAQEFAQPDPHTVLPPPLHEVHNFLSRRHPDVTGASDATRSFAASERTRLANQAPAPDDLG
jgi:hypothetical protein